MTSALYDFAIIGENPASKFLAGLLTRDHKRRCVLLADNEIRVRLPQSSGTSFAPLTRPDHWAMLAPTVPETLKVLSRIGAKNATQRTKVICLAKESASREALSHVRTMAELYGHTVEIANTSRFPSNILGLSVPDITHLDLVGINEHLDQWLDDLGVARVLGAGLRLLKDGSSTLQIGTEALAFRQTVLMDDKAVIEHLPISQRPRIVRGQVHSSLLIAPNQPLAAPIVFDIDSGSTLTTMASGGINLISPGDNALAFADAHRLLAMGVGGAVVGQRSFTRLLTTDGLAAFGRVGINSGAVVALAAEPYAPFIVPALARWIAGVPTETESAYFSARLVTRSANCITDVIPTRLMSAS
jgi:hypothetical protein